MGKEKSLLIILSFIFSLILLSNCISAIGFSSLESLGTGKQGQNFTILQSCNGATYITIGGILLPDKTVKAINENMTSIGSGTFTYNFTVTTQLGTYCFSKISDCPIDAVDSCFDITPSGKVTTIAESILYFIMVIVMLSLCLLLFYFILVLPLGNEQDEQGNIIGIVKLKYLKITFIAIMYPMIIILLNLINGLAVNFTSLDIFANQIGFLEEIMIRGAWVFFILIACWIIYLLIRDTNIKRLMKSEGYISNG